jgi:hypothetical protein
MNSENQLEQMYDESDCCRANVGEVVDRGGAVSMRYKTVADIKKLSI